MIFPKRTLDDSPLSNAGIKESIEEIPFEGNSVYYLVTSV